MANELLIELNAFRATEGKEPFKDWRKARHMPMLETYRAAAATPVDAFEASEEELASQVVRVKASESMSDETLAVEDADKVLAELVEENKKANEKIEKPQRVLYKQMERHEKSTVEKPLVVIHSFLDANPTLKRKDAIQQLIDMGINYYTARTQYQKGFSKRK